MPIRAALIDMDGTIYDSGLDWLSIRREIGLERDGRPILAQLADAPPEVRERGLETLHRVEAYGAENGRLMPGAPELLGLLRSRGVRCALVTNNSRRSADTVLARYRLSFDCVLTRDDGAAKPEPEVFVRALARLQTDPSEAVAIGDAHLDLIAAHRAGIGEIVLVGTPPWMKGHMPPDAEYHAAADLREAREILERLLAA